MRPCGNGYYTTLVPNDQKIYIMDCIGEDDRVTWRGKRFFEIYMVEYNSYGNAIVKRICNTLEANSPLIAVVNSLIKTIIVSVSHVHIDDSVRSAIDAYMNGKRAVAFLDKDKQIKSYTTINEINDMFCILDNVPEYNLDF